MLWMHIYDWHHLQSLGIAWAAACTQDVAPQPTCMPCRTNAVYLDASSLLPLITTFILAQAGHSVRAASSAMNIAGWDPKGSDASETQMVRGLLLHTYQLCRLICSWERGFPIFTPVHLCLRLIGRSRPTLRIASRKSDPKNENHLFGSCWDLFRTIFDLK